MAEPARFQLVEEPADPPAGGQVEPVGQKIATDAIFLALRTLSQKSLVALASLFTLITVGSVFALWFKTPDPNTFQIISLSIYASFVLAANWIVRRK
jgi:hypothetical protein